MHSKPSIILIRETDAQLTGSGCCGKLEGDNAKFSNAFVFSETRQLKAAYCPYPKNLLSLES